MGRTSAGVATARMVVATRQPRRVNDAVPRREAAPPLRESDEERCGVSERS